jgi:DNA-binding FrmR family transcriptional regulator
MNQASNQANQANQAIIHQHLAGCVAANGESGIESGIN